MAGINFIGSYSGMDQGVIDKLMAVEKRPLITFAEKKTDLEARQGAWKDVATRLKNLLDKIKALSKTETLYSKTTASSEEAIVSASGTRDAVSGQYEVLVKQLATQTKMTGSKVAQTDFDTALNLTGNLTLGAGDKTAQITIEASQSLRTVVRNINLESTNTGVTATVVDGRMVLKSSSYGADPMTVSSEQPAVLEALGLNTVEEVLGQGSIFSVNGIEMTRDSNTVSDAVLGMSLQLKQETDIAAPVVITVSEDSEKTIKAFQEFVDQYNSTMSFLKAQTAAGTREVPGSQGKLYGESSLVRFQNSLRQGLTSDLPESASIFKNLSEIGITTIDKEGTLMLDAEKLKTALKETPNEVQKLLAGDELQTGMSGRLEGLIEGLTDKSNGMIQVKSSSLERTLKDLNRRITDFEDKMTKREAYYINMFSKLDVAMQKAETQSNWLAAQLGGMQNQE
ncbi:flagellar filament capping protein FliD [Acidaminobacter hydrogenoformans]|uniref:Flagellar hook-associated protein 2 n=1 Tax=Acidaminobacter hydrogenoformans DSM 2784 TaxID=1120920 RepID=A0A1G5RV83_9FIRM|nr:flagellar filament capping protein FliD [Acidaminobacter hydrogenoformans]SCZ77817.1 flagellar hook-associated protein 2 [Acidaminobacter hydrogenoformans DSM 2784]